MIWQFAPYGRSLSTMRMMFLIALLMATPATAQQITMIDATTLTVEQLMAMAAAERDAPTPLSCCDWGGLGCVVHKPGS